MYGPAGVSAPWPKCGKGRGRAPARGFDRLEGRLPGEGTEGHDDAELREEDQLAVEIRCAPVAFIGERRVGGRCAPHGGRDVGAAQLEAIVGADRHRLVRKPDAVEGGEEEVAAPVAGEDASRPVAAVLRRREAEEQDASAGVAESGDRAGVIRLAAEAGRRVRGSVLAPGNQARAGAAGADLGGQRGEGVGDAGRGRGRGRGHGDVGRGGPAHPRSVPVVGLPPSVTGGLPGAVGIADESDGPVARAGWPATGCPSVGPGRDGSRILLNRPETPRIALKAAS